MNVIVRLNQTIENALNDCWTIDRELNKIPLSIVDFTFSKNIEELKCKVPGEPSTSTYDWIIDDKEREVRFEHVDDSMIAYTSEELVDFYIDKIRKEHVEAAKEELNETLVAAQKLVKEIEALLVSDEIDVAKANEIIYNLS